MEMPMQNNEEVLQAVLQNNTLLNTLRSEVAAVQGDLRDAVMQQQTAMSGMEPLMPVAELHPFHLFFLLVPSLH